MVATNKEKEAEYNLIVKKAKEIESVRQRLRSELIELNKRVSDWEQKYDTFHRKSYRWKSRVSKDSTVERASLPMTRETRVGTQVLVAEYLDILSYKIVGEYILWSKYW
jgi:hypothetical protein